MCRHRVLPVLSLVNDDIRTMDGLQDEITGKEWDVKAKCIINATGPFTDTVRKMDDPSCVEICCPSSGVHIVLPGYYRCVPTNRTTRSLAMVERQFQIIEFT